MSMRPLKAPDDLGTLGEMATRAFVYPENPAWSVDADERRGMEDTVRNARRLWPLVRALQVVTPSMREMFIGLVWEEDGKPAGLTQYQKMGDQSVWNLNTVAVLPEYRRRGIARRLVQATLEDVRRRGGRTVVLGVIDGNTPAYTLYESLGFRRFGGNHELRCDLAVAPGAVPVPPGYRLTPIGRREGPERFAAAVRLTPAGVQDYVPVDPNRWTTSGGKRALMALMERIQGMRLSETGIRDATGTLVGWTELHARSAGGGGLNRAHLRLDLEHAAVAPYMVRSLIDESLRLSPGIRLQVEIDSWATPLLEAALEAGCVRRLEYHALGVRL